MDDERIAVIWPGSALMADTDAESFEIATSILSNVSDSLANAEATAGHTKQVAILLA